VSPFPIRSWPAAHFQEGRRGPVAKDGGAIDRRLQAVCDGALAVVRDRLEKVTLAELAKGR
jgi:hypothetical protein